METGRFPRAFGVYILQGSLFPACPCQWVLARRREAFPLCGVGVVRSAGRRECDARRGTGSLQSQSTGCGTKQAVIIRVKCLIDRPSSLCVLFRLGLSGACFRRASPGSRTTISGERRRSLGSRPPGCWSRVFAPRVLSEPRCGVAYGTRGLKMAPPPTLILGVSVSFLCSRR